MIDKIDIMKLKNVTAGVFRTNRDFINLKVVWKNARITDKECKKSDTSFHLSLFYNDVIEK